MNDVCKHLIDIIEEPLIYFCRQTYLPVLVSEQECEHSRVVNGLVCGVSVQFLFWEDARLVMILVQL